MTRDDFYKLFAKCMDVVERVPAEQRPKLLEVAEQLLHHASRSADALMPANAPSGSTLH
jgi:hypothetical protein